MKKSILRAYDFIKAWMYYPQMVTYIGRLGFEPRKTRFQCALWHCQTGKLSDTGYENLRPTVKEISDDWEKVYAMTPVENRTS